MALYGMVLPRLSMLAASGQRNHQADYNKWSELKWEKLSPDAKWVSV
jgi:hypothetical protein